MTPPALQTPRRDADAAGTWVIIPARLASERFPRKVLADDTGTPLVQHVVDRVAHIEGIDGVVVAADDVRVADALAAYGTRVVMTPASCRTGTERVAEAARVLGLAADAIVVNVQGDEPEIEPHVVERLVARMGDADRPGFATVHVPFPAPPVADVADANLVKVALSADGQRCVWFSRSPIPFARAGPAAYRLHVGIYAYRVATLLDLAATPPTPCEQAESLEQLRALETHVVVAAVGAEGHAGGIDTPAQYAAFVARDLARRHGEVYGRPDGSLEPAPRASASRAAACRPL